MKLITKEEKEKMPLRGRGSSSKVFRAVVEMEPGQILFIEPEDWGKRKYPPSQLMHQIEKRYKREYSALTHAAKKGWVVERVS